MKKTAGVYTNDKNLSQQDLVIFGQVENFVTLRPKHVILRGVAGDPIESMVTIIPEKKYPFKIIDAKAQNGENIKIEMKEIAKSNGSGYELKVKNLKATTGRYYDTIILKTDSSVQPELNVRVYGYMASSEANESEALSEQTPDQGPEGMRPPPWVNEGPVSPQGLPTVLGNERPPLPMDPAADDNNLEQNENQPQSPSMDSDAEDVSPPEPHE